MDIFKKNRLTMWVIVLLVVLNLLTISAIWMKNFPRFDKRKSGGEAFLIEELKLTDEQAEQFRELREIHFDETKEIHREMNDLRKAITDELFRENPDSAKVMRWAREVGEMHSAIERARFLHFQALKEPLEPEQRDKFRAVMRELQRKRPGPGGPPGRGPRGPKPRRRGNGPPGGF